MSSRNQKHEVQKLGKQQWSLQRLQSLAIEHEMRDWVLQTRHNLNAAQNAHNFAACRRCTQNQEGVQIFSFLGKIHLPLSNTISPKRYLKKVKAFFLWKLIPPFHSKTYSYFTQSSIPGLLGLGKSRSQLFHNFSEMSRGLQCKNNAHLS